AHPDFAVVSDAPDDETALVGVPAGLWPRIDASIEDTLAKIATGDFESLSADVYADFGIRPGEENTDLTKAIKDLKETAEAQGRLLVVKPQTFSPFNIIVGIAGDHS